jgi:hypothetical protein
MSNKPMPRRFYGLRAECPWCESGSGREVSKTTWVRGMTDSQYLGKFPTDTRGPGRKVWTLVGGI